MRVASDKRISIPDWEKYYQGTQMGAEMHASSLLLLIDRNAGETHRNMDDWCQDHCSGRFFIQHNTPERVFFQNPEDRMLCLMKFGGQDANKVR